MRPSALLLLAALSACAHTTEVEVAPPIALRLASLPIPGDPAFVEIARDVLQIRAEMAPNLVAEVGLLDDALQVPSFAPDSVSAWVARLDADLAAMRALPWRSWSVDRQIDLRWVFAVAEEARQRLVVEQRWHHRPAEWLEPVSATFVAYAALAPDRPQLGLALAGMLPGMVAEMESEVSAPTARDVTTAHGMIEGTVLLLGTLPLDPRRDAAISALQRYDGELGALMDLPDHEVVGADAYAWRLSHAMLLPWDPDQLLAQAEAERTRVEAELAELAPRLIPPALPTPEEEAEARALDRAGLLALYDDAVAQNLAALRTMGVLTVPADLPAIHARETPEAIVPLTGDGGSMNPPPLFGPARDGWWNVEHWNPALTFEERLADVLTARRERETGFGPYAVHEGVPGHHLQLSIARGIENPLRTILTDHASVEGWALYAEELFWEGGGFGDSDRARNNVLRSYRARIRRVFYDVNVETGRWTLQEGADWKYEAAPGQGTIDPDVQRTIQWPTQLIGYFAGKAQIVALREELRAREGDAFDARVFHDALLQEGCIPLSLVRAKLLGEPVPDLP